MYTHSPQITPVFSAKYTCKMLQNNMSLCDLKTKHPSNFFLIVSITATNRDLKERAFKVQLLDYNNITLSAQIITFVMRLKYKFRSNTEMPFCALLAFGNKYIRFNHTLNLHFNIWRDIRK